jgi:hypothetical protein
MRRASLRSGESAWRHSHHAMLWDVALRAKSCARRNLVHEPDGDGFMAQSQFADLETAEVIERSLADDGVAGD